VLHWIRNTPRLCYRPLVCAVIEPDGYASAPELYDALGRDGVRVMVVPSGYTTALGARGKARALQYASESRVALGLSNSSTWIYHQDEETCVGEDTMLGISDFVRSGKHLAGSGVILYPIDWNGTPTHVQEMTRSYDDFRVLDSMTEPGNPTAGFHGSHILMRADAEDAVGWDERGYSPAEDLAFEIRFRARFGTVFGVLSGFAYEKGAYSLADQLRQRRRWVHGVMHAVLHSHDLPVSRRVTVAYSALSWFSALPSILVLVASLFVHYGPLLLVTGAFTGFVWVSMITAYLEGFRLHAEYVRPSMSIPRLALHGLVGAFVDILAPWYALVTRPTMQDFIPKERPTSSAHPAGARATD
jgi:beta-1,4-mannosyltransferase